MILVPLFHFHRLPTAIGCPQTTWYRLEQGYLQSALPLALPYICVVECPLVSGVKRGCSESFLDLGGIHLTVITNLINVDMGGNTTKKLWLVAP